MEWISVKDRLPDNDDEQLVCIGEDVYTYQYNPWGDDKNKGWFGWEDIPSWGSEKHPVHGVSYWMPLPKAPKEVFND